MQPKKRKRKVEDAPNQKIKLRTDEKNEKIQK